MVVSLDFHDVNGQKIRDSNWQQRTREIRVPSEMRRYVREEEYDEKRAVHEEHKLLLEIRSGDVGLLAIK